MEHIVIVGAGQAGASMAARLRSLGFEGRITMIGDEPHLPYQRPPLSKKYMLGEMALERLFHRPESFYEDHGIKVRTGCRALSIDTSRKTVALEGGEELGWDALALCTGAMPIRLPASVGGDLEGVHVMRTLADADAMAAGFQPGRRVLIVGGGYIGLEAAAVAASKGLKVTLVEKEARILARVAARETADYFRELHGARGVEILEDSGLSELRGSEGRVSSAVLENGQALPVDFVIVGIGIRPSTALAQAAGLALDNGIAVDAFGRTSAEGVFAVGDCASFPYGDTRLRLESVPHAIDHAEATAASMLGQGVPYVPKPWFWSDQYDVKLQIAGLNTGFDEVVVREGEKPGVQSNWYFNGKKLLAVDAMNDARAYMVGKRLIEAGKSPLASAVADRSVPLKELPLVTDATVAAE